MSCKKVVISLIYSMKVWLCLANIKCRVAVQKYFGIDEAVMKVHNKWLLLCLIVKVNVCGLGYIDE